MCILLETKRREEEIGSDIEIPGYTLRELRRSDTAGDRGGGGLAVYTRQLDGLVFQEYSPDIEDQDCHFVRNERMWITTKSLSTKSAVCGRTMGVSTRTIVIQSGMKQSIGWFMLRLQF